MELDLADFMRSQWIVPTTRTHLAHPGKDLRNGPRFEIGMQVKDEASTTSPKPPTP